MNVDVEFDDASVSIDIPSELLHEAQDYFDKLDSDMDRGWQMSRWWVPNLDAVQRCQVVADKLLTAIQDSNEQYASLLCAYILSKLPATHRILINTKGQIQGNEFLPG